MDIGSTIASDFNQQTEGPIARAIEKQTSKLPSDLFLWAAGASIVGSLVFQVLGNRQVVSPGPSKFGQISLFVGQWAPTLLMLGLYNKIVKVAGSDKYTPTP